MKSQKGNTKRDPKQIENVLAEAEIAHKVVVRLPQSLCQNEGSLNKHLISQYLLNKILNKRIKRGIKFVALYLGREENFEIVKVDNQQINSEEITSQNADSQKHQETNQRTYVVKQSTKIQLSFQKNSKLPSLPLQQSTNQKAPRIQFLSNELQGIKLAIISSLQDRQQYLQNGLGPLKGIIISGFSGTGKTTLARNVLHEVREHYQKSKQVLYTRLISSINLLSKVVGGAEEYIRATFAELKEKQPSVLVIEDLHLLFSEKQISANRTAMAGLISEMEAIEEEKVVVVGTVNADYQLAGELKGSGRFEKQITLNLPTHPERLKLLQAMCQSLSSSSTLQTEQLKSLNLRMNGFSIGEIKQIIREAYTANYNCISFQTIEAVLKNYKPSEIKELIVEVPEVHWKDIGGYEHVKGEIRKVAELPLKHPEVFKRFGIDPIKGIMLYGPPGCSKTMMAKAIATETKLNFIGVKGPELFSKYVGDSEKAVRNIFKRARACSPCIIFFDEIDAIAASRSSNAQVSDRVLCQLLNEMDGIEGLKQVIIIAATNKPEILDPALTRPGRFDYMIYISPPDLDARKEIFRIYLSKNQNLQKVSQLADSLALKTDGYTGAEISLVCRQSALIALQENIECTDVLLKHYQLALKKVKKRLSIETIAKYKNFEDNLKY